ncbi:MAG TPA: GNAT family acetyltransferase [Stellaceae bacterium]|nr:GNAT family acetyltransferase [Stellaceae bacterium]
MPLTIRAATATDKDAVARLWTRAGLTTSYNDPGEDFSFALGRDGSDVLVGVSDGKVVASVMVGHDGHRGWLYYVAVDPRCRKRGYGGAIVEAGERWLSERQIRKVLLLVRDTNTAVVGFYESLQYEVAPRVVMQKWLVPRPSAA